MIRFARDREVTILVEDKVEIIEHLRMTFDPRGARGSHQAEEEEAVRELRRILASQILCRSFRSVLFVNHSLLWG